MWDRIRRLLCTIGSTSGVDFVMLVAALLLVIGVWSFIELADEVVEGETRATDLKILLALRNPADPADALGPTWLEEAVRDITALGGNAVLGLLTISVVGYLWISGRSHAALFILTATVGGTLLAWSLKQMYARPRPDIVPHLSSVISLSFPSSHAQVSTVVYLTLGTILARLVPEKRRKVYIMGLALLITLLVGASRVYLGVHYPSDILAGWMAGFAWALLCWLAARYFQRRRMIENVDA